MSWKKLLQDNKVHRHTTSRQELTDIRRLIARELADAAIIGDLKDRLHLWTSSACLIVRITCSPLHVRPMARALSLRTE